MIFNFSLLSIILVIKFFEILKNLIAVWIKRFNTHSLLLFLHFHRLVDCENSN